MVPNAFRPENRFTSFQIPNDRERIPSKEERVHRRFFLEKRV